MLLSTAILCLKQIKIHIFFLMTYLRCMQFSYTKKGYFPDDFMSLNEIHNSNLPR